MKYCIVYLTLLCYNCALHVKQFDWLTSILNFITCIDHDFIVFDHINVYSDVKTNGRLMIVNWSSTKWKSICFQFEFDRYWYSVVFNQGMRLHAMQLFVLKTKITILGIYIYIIMQILLQLIAKALVFSCTVKKKEIDFVTLFSVFNTLMFFGTRQTLFCW